MRRLLAALLALVFVMTFTLCAAAEQMPTVTDEPLIDDVPLDEEEDDGELEVASWDETDYDDLPEDEQITVADLALTGDLPDEWFNILLLGTDNRYESKTYGRTDSMILMSVNFATGEAKLTSFMRDTWVPIHGRKSKAKLNAACVYGGPELTMRTLNECFGLNIQYYALINITGLADIIDSIGGVVVDVTEKERNALNKGLFDLSSQSGMEKLQEYGPETRLNGNQAVAYSRIRKIDSDFVRTERQREVLTAMAKQLKDCNNLVTIIGVVNTLMPYVETNLDITQMMTLANLGMNMDLSTIEQFRIPADHTYDAGTFDGTWCIKCNFDKNTTLLHEFIYG